MILLPGIAAFVLFILFDLNKINGHRRWMNLLFGIGAVLLIGSTVGCIWQTGPAWSARMIPGLVGTAVSAAALLYALFFALPFGKTYAGSDGLPLVSSGIYGLCRHPGFWPFLALYVCLWLTFGGRLLLTAMLVYPLCNGIYIYIQDRWIFPKFIQGYDAYRQSVPFLIPRRRR